MMRPGTQNRLYQMIELYVTGHSIKEIAALHSLSEKHAARLLHSPEGRALIRRFHVKVEDAIIHARINMLERAMVCLPSQKAKKAGG